MGVMIRREFLERGGFKVADVEVFAKLDQNESPFDLPIDLKEELWEDFRFVKWNRYPQPKDYYEKVKEKFSDIIGVEPDRLMLTMGADQGIYLFYSIIDGKIVIFEPTYPMFRGFARFVKADIFEEILGIEYVIDETHIDKGDVFVIVSPNSPTGNLQNKEVVEYYLKNNKVVLVDEVYYPFCKWTVKDLIYKYENLVILRSFSKVGLAGIRLGYVISSPEYIQAMENAIFAPYHLTLFNLFLFENFNKIAPYVEYYVQKIIEERGRVYKELSKYFKVYPSHTNFLLFEVENPKKIFEDLVAKGVRVRDVSSLPGLSNHLRVTIGNREENDYFLNKIKEIISK